ncbi:MAG: hypothetical protein H7318_00380 [Oligoflexus sp.]|nr:hypothetical protein [Oligoflexus sp.]
MNESVKSISLDDIGDLPNPIGMAGPGEKTKNKALHYNPQYGGLSETPYIGRSRPSEGTQRVEDSSYFSSTLTRFSEILGPIKGQSGNRNIMILAVLLLIVIGVGAFLYLGDSLFGDGAPAEDTAAEASADLSAEADAKGKEAAVSAQAGGEGKTPAETKAALDKAKVETSVVQEIPGNPYWKLPNPVAALSETPAPITTQQTEAWRGGLAHPFSYQRYKSVEDMRKAKMDGSVAILYEALAQPKFWTRMEALLGIAEQGIPIDTDSMHAAIGDARPDLVRNYFRRFKNNYTDVTAHVMRQALRVVDQKSRHLILMQLAAHRNETNDMYLIAGLHDADAMTKDFAQTTLTVAPAVASTKQAYDKAMSEVAVLVVAPPRAKVSAQDIKVEKIPANMNVEEVYFINDEEQAPVVEAPKEEVKVDDGFNALDHRDTVPTEVNHANEAKESNEVKDVKVEKNTKEPKTKAKTEVKAPKK